MKQLTICIVFLTLICPKKSYSENIINDIKVTHLTNVDGLSNNTITSICKDSDGFMWFGTAFGLNRYDGINITTYKSVEGDSTSISDNHITSLLNDNRGRLWVGTKSRGLMYYNPEYDNFTRFRLTKNKENYDLIEIRGITCCNNGTIYVATINKGIYSINKNYTTNFSTSSTSNRINTNNITSIYSHKNRVYFGGKTPYMGIIDSESNSITELTIRPDSLPVYCTAITTDKSNNIWISSKKSGLYKIIPEKNFFQCWTQSNSSLKSNILVNLSKDDNDNIWIAGIGGGLSVINSSGKLKTFNTNPFLPKELNSDKILSIYHDNSGITWVGTAKSGINIIDPYKSQYNTRNIYDGLSNNKVLCFYELDYNNILVGTDGGGLSLFNRKSSSIEKINITYKPYRNNKYAADIITRIIRFDENHLLISSYGEGVFLFNIKKRVMKSILPDCFRDNNDKDIFTTDIIIHNNKIWFSTTYSLFVKDLKSNTIRKIYISNSDDNTKDKLLNSVASLFIKGDWLYAATKSGIVRIDTKTERVISIHKINKSDKKLPIRENNILHISEYNNNELVVGTIGDGVYFFDSDSGEFQKPGIFKKINKLRINDIIKDNSGGLWICSYSGIHMIDIMNSHIEKYDFHNGLQGFQFECAMKSVSGELFFGGEYGFNHFDPENIRSNKNLPEISFTNLKLFNKEVDFNDPDSPIDKHISRVKNICFKYEQNVITIGFVALNLTSPSLNRYSYYLDGFEESWNTPSSRHSATYTGLKPGDYIFKVKACNNDNQWNHKFKSINITILPPWYKTIWAYIAYALIILILLFLFFRNIVEWNDLKHKLEIETIEKKKIEEINSYRTTLFTNISHEFKTPLSLIIDPVSQLIKSGKGPQSQYQIISNNANLLLRLINQLMDFRKIENSGIKLKKEEFSINILIQKVKNDMLWLFHRHNIKLSYNPIREIIVDCDKDKISKILYNLLSNALKACSANDNVKICTEADTEKNEVIISVTDTGKGIKKKHINKIFDRFFQVEYNFSGTGVGLSMVKSYCELHSGRVWVESEEGKGSTFYVAFKYEKVADLNNTSVEEITTPSENQNNPTTNFDVHKKTILIVEDNYQLLRYLYTSLCDSYNIIEAENGKEGFNLTVRHNPDIIISDIMMPVEDGISMCNRIKNDIRFNHIPIILLTAKSGHESMLEGAESGADIYMEKPFSVDVIKANLKNILNKQEVQKKRYTTILNNNNEEFNPKSTEESFLAKATFIVEKHLTQTDFSVEILSREIAMHRTNLHSKLKKLTGLTPSEFIRSVKLKAAMKLIKKGADNISEIAYRTGFNTPSYFTKCFKQKYGKLPNEVVKGREGI